MNVIITKNHSSIHLNVMWIFKINLASYKALQKIKKPILKNFQASKKNKHRK